MTIRLWGLLLAAGMLLQPAIWAQEPKITADGFSYQTPYYQLQVDRNPVRVHLGWDVEGEGDYERVMLPEIADSQWASTLYAGIDGFTNKLAGDAGGVFREPGSNSITVSAIPVAPGLSADWRFTCADDSFTYRVTWYATEPVEKLFNLGHQWVHDLDEVLVDGELAQGDLEGFGERIVFMGQDIAVELSLEEASTELQANRFVHGNGIALQSIFTPGGSLLEEGTYEGGTWQVSARAPREEESKVASNYIGQFEVEGEYFKDFFVLQDGDTYHLFYNVGAAGPKQDWQDPGNEEKFGHATSKDLKDWTLHEPVLPIVDDSWEDTTVSAPSILKIGDTWKMIYTGFDQYYTERIGLAESEDLFNWTRYEGNPVYEGPEWTAWKAGQWADCRDAHIIPYNDYYLMYTMVVHESGKGSVAIARSEDLIDWEDLGPAFLQDGPPESPIIMENGGVYYLIVSAAGGSYKSDDPEANDWQPVQLNLPPRHQAWEIIEDEDGESGIIAGFTWKMNGNHIRFWRYTWQDGELKVDY